MQRKVIQLAGKTLVVSLPRKWVKKEQIEKGQEIELVEDGPSIIINPSQQKKELKTCLDLAGLNSSLMWEYVTAAYIKGFDEVEIRFSDAEIMNPRTKTNVKAVEFISSIAQSLIGMEVVRYGNTVCVLKEISMIRSEDFVIMLKRLFFSIHTMASDTALNVEKKEWQEIALAQELEKNVNRWSFFCWRALNKGVCSANEQSLYFYIIACLEEIGDAYAEIIGVLVKNKTTKLQERLHVAADMVRKLSVVFYDFEKNKYQEWYNIFRAEKEVLEKSMKNPAEGNILHAINRVYNACRNVLSARIMLAV